MEPVFLKVVNMSLTASWLILAVAVVRVLFRRMPKWVMCLLWGMVAVRLLCPVALEWEHSVLPSAEPLPKDIIYTARPQLQSDIIIVDNTVNPMLASSMTPIEPASANPTQIWSFILSQVWILGMAIMLLLAYLGNTELLTAINEVLTELLKKDASGKSQIEKMVMNHMNLD
mgnify:CR=1 FL=1